MKILMVVAYFPPEIGSAAHIYYDLARAFIKKGHEVLVLTSYPREFNLDKSDVGKEFPYHAKMDEIEVHRSKHFVLRDFPLFRGFEHFFLPYHYFSEYKKMKINFDVCLLYIPPLPLYQLANKIRKYDATPSVLNYQDFHPQELIDVNYGGMKNNFVMIKLLERMEKRSYMGADFITVLSEGGIDYVVNRGADPSRVTHIYNGIQPSDIEKFESRQDFKEKEKIEDKFLISYAGFLSPFQGIDNILDVACELKEQEDIIFYVAGDGMIKKDLEDRIKNEDIYNLKLLPFQPRNEYLNIVNSSDISIVSLDKRMTAPCLPGKLTNILALKQPIIGIVSPESETANFIRRVKCGILVEPGDVNGFKNAISKLKENPDLRKTLGENGRKFVENEMNLEKNVELYQDIFTRMVECI
jgi:colanic acid biosynthesis glycosyl transferase WcaI